jgi:aldose 1-epimerase
MRNKMSLGYVLVVGMAAGTAGAVLGLGAPAQAAAAKATLSISKEAFGRTQDGQPVELVTLRNARGMTAKVMTYGGVIYSVEVPDRNGVFTNVTINRPTVTDYETKSACFGALLGRYANRIGNAQFAIDGETYKLPANNGRNHIHGGMKGFDKRLWKPETMAGKDYVALALRLESGDGEEGYPGNVACTVTYTLNNKNELKIEYSASTDKPTVLNLSNHAYWNLAGSQSGDVLNQVLRLNADRYLVVDEGLIPTGEEAPVKGTPLDFTKPHAIGERMGEISGKQFNHGYDHCFVVNRKAAGALVVCAKLKDPGSGRTLEVLTTEPGIQVYSANFPAGAFEGFNGYAYPSHCGVALETQHFPDSPNKPGFPSTLLRPGQTYHSTTLFRFGVE